MASDLETIRVNRNNDTVTVTLNRPEVHNAFNAAVISEITSTFRTLSAETDIRVIVLQGEGKSFCAGADVNWMRSSLDLSEQENKEDALRMSDMFAFIDEAPQCVIGRVHGAALGGGMGLISVCDIVVAAEGTVFGFTEARLGIIPAVISRFVVPKIGASWARRLFLTAERFDATLAVRIGLVHEIVSVDELDDAVARHIEQVRRSSPQAVREGKALIAGLLKLPEGEQQRQFTAQRIAAVRTTAEGQDGLRAFLEKRDPGWRLRHM